MLQLASSVPDCASPVRERAGTLATPTHLGPKMTLELTEAARLAARRDLAPGEALRIAFAGGCGALGFRVAAARRSIEGDFELEAGGVRLLLDLQAVRELDGATLDWDEQEGFRLDHPGWGVSC